MDYNIVTIFFNSTATTLDSFGIDTLGSYRIIGFSIAAILVGYISLLILALDKKQNWFSNYQIYEKLIFSYFIGGIALGSIIALASLVLIITPTNRLEATAFGSIITASIFSSIILYTVADSKTKAITMKSIMKYFVANFLVILAVVWIVSLIFLVLLILPILYSSITIWQKIGFILSSLWLIFYSGRVARNTKKHIKDINDGIEAFFAKKRSSSRMPSKR